MIVVWLKNRSAKLAVLVGCPVILAILLACAGTWTLPVFKLGSERLEYRIGAQMYTSTGNDNMEGRRFAYPSPASWPNVIRDISLWLLFHLILGILFAIYLAMLCVSLFFRKPYPTQAIVSPRWWSFIPAVTLAALIIALTSRDAVFWSRGGQYGLQPDVLGYFLIIGGLLVGMVWLWALASLQFGDVEYVGSNRGKNVTHYEPRSQKHTHDHDRSDERSKGATNWWDRMTRA